MTDNHPLKTFRLRVKGEIYDRVYDMQDFEMVLNLFNEIHQPSMKIIIEEKEGGENE